MLTKMSTANKPNLTSVSIAKDTGTSLGIVHLVILTQEVEESEVVIPIVVIAVDGVAVGVVVEEDGDTMSTRSNVNRTSMKRCMKNNFSLSIWIPSLLFPMKISAGVHVHGKMVLTNAVVVTIQVTELRKRSLRNISKH